MAQKLEERLERLEEKVADLSRHILDLRTPSKDWQRTVGSMPNDELTREAERLGQEYRKQQTYEREIAGS